MSTKMGDSSGQQQTDKIQPGKVGLLVKHYKYSVLISRVVFTDYSRCLRINILNHIVSVPK